MSDEAIYALIQAIGMFSENLQRYQHKESLAYTDEDFNNLIP